MKKIDRRTFIMCLVTCFYWFGLYAYVPILSPYAESTGASHKMVGLIVGSYGFTQMLLRIPLGIISDRMNSRKPFVVIGILLGLISALGLWVFDNPIMLLISRSIAGMAAATWVTYTVLFSSYFNGDEAPKAIGILNSVTSFGQMAVMLLGGITAQYFSDRSTFLLAGVLATMGLILSMGIEENTSSNRKPLKIPQLLQVGKDPQLLLISMLAVVSQILTFATVYGFTPVAAKNIGASSFQLSMLTTLSTLPGIFASVLSGVYLVRRFNERVVVVWGFIINAAACLVIPFIQTMSLLYISQFIGGFGRGILFPVLMALSIKTVEEGRRATAMGFFQAIYGLGMFLGPVIVGFFSDTTGLDWGFYITGLIGFAGALITGLFLRVNKTTPGA